MKRFMFTFLACFMLAGPVYAQDTAPAAAVEAVTEAPKADTPKADEKPTIGEVVKDGAAVVAAVEDVKDAKKAGEGLYLAIMAMLTAIFKFALSGVKLSGPFWKGRRGKTVLRLVTIGLGAAAAFTAGFLDASWVDAIMVGLSGPLAVAFHEYTVLLPSLSKKKDAAKAPS